MIETYKRSILKSLGWRILGFFILGGITWIFTHRWDLSAEISVTFNLIRFFLYIVHERIWDRIPYGRNIPGTELGPAAREQTSTSIPTK